MEKNNSKQHLFLQSLFYLQMTYDLGRGEKITPTIFITNDSKKIESLITKNLRSSVGNIEIETLLKSTAVIYAIDEDESGFTEPIPLLNSYIGTVQAFLMCLWLIKDNSVDSELGFLETPYPNSFSNVSSNAHSTKNTNAQGEVNLTTFNRDELQTARKISREVFGLKDIKDTYEEPSQSKLKKGVPRLSRTLYFISGARSTSDLGLKIANYCSAFEALFLTGSTELSHKLAERVAIFSGNSSEKKRDVYFTIRTAYNIRSKILHGDVLSEKELLKLKETSIKCDDSLRAIVSRIISSSELYSILNGPPKEVEEYFIDLTFGIKN